MIDSYFLVSDENLVSFIFFSKETETCSIELFDENKNNFEDWVRWIKNEFFKNKNHRNKILLTSGRFTIIPNTLFVPTSSHTLFELTLGKTRIEEQVYFNFIPAFQSTLVFGKHKKSEILRTLLNDNSSISHIIPLLSNFINIASRSNIPFLFVGNKYAIISIQVDNKLICVHHFTLETTEDIIYYVLSLFKSYNLKNIKSIDLVSLDNEIKADELNKLFKLMEISSEIRVVDTHAFHLSKL